MKGVFITNFENKMGPTEQSNNREGERVYAIFRNR